MFIHLTESDIKNNDKPVLMNVMFIDLTESDIKNND